MRKSRPHPVVIERGLQISYNNVIAELCRKSYYDFVKEFWTEINDDPFIPNWHIKYICDEVQYVIERVIARKPKEYDLIINVPPGMSKSTSTTIMANPWAWTRDPSLRFITGSFVFELAMDLSRKSRDIILSDKYKELYSEIQLREDQKSKTNFQNTRKGTRVAKGTGGIAGIHAHIIMIDDPLDPKEAPSEAKLQEANHWLFEVISRRKVEQSLTPTILIMQRLHQDDPTANALERWPNVKHICLPGELSDNVKPKILRKKYVNGLLDPKRMSKEVLKESHKTLGDYGYAGQIMQTPTPPGGAMFKIDRLQYGIAGIHWRRKVRYWDKAGTKDGGAYTVGVLMGLDTKDRYWVLNVIRGQWDSAAREDVILSTARHDGVEVMIGVEQEPGSGGKDSAVATVKNLKGFNCRIDLPTGDKTARADPYSAQVNVGNVWLVEAPWNFDYVEELKYFPNSKYKDQVDASSGAFKLISEPFLVVGKKMF